MRYLDYGLDGQIVKSMKIYDADLLHELQKPATDITVIWRIGG